jgi:hypothetical protein
MDSPYALEQLAKCQRADVYAALRHRLPAASTSADIADRLPVAVEPLLDMPPVIARLVAAARSLARPVAGLGARLS